MERTLVLTPWMAPHRLINWQDAVQDWTLGKCEILETYDETISSAGSESTLPRGFIGARQSKTALSPPLQDGNPTMVTPSRCSAVRLTSFGGNGRGLAVGVMSSTILDGNGLVLPCSVRACSWT